MVKFYSEYVDKNGKRHYGINFYNTVTGIVTYFSDHYFQGLKKMKKLYAIEYNHGVHSPITVEAESVEEAEKIALVEYRKRSTSVDNFSAEFIVSSVTEVIER